MTSAALALAAAIYLTGAHTTVSRPRPDGRREPWPRRRSAAFLAGLALVGAGLQSGLDSYAGQLLSVHMVQHLTLTLLAPPLLLLGAPVTLCLRALPPPARRPLGRLVTSAGARALGQPAVAWPLFTAVLLGTHLTPFYDAAIRDPVLHGLEHLVYLSTALLFWLPVVGADPAPRPREPALRVLYLLLAMPPMALVGVVLVSQSSVRYPAYLEPARELGIEALADQRLGGAIMWVAGALALVGAAVAVGWAAAAREERRALAREAYADGRPR